MIVGVSYSKLFKLLIDKKMKKKDLIIAAGISPSSMAKLGRDEYVSLEVIVKICKALDVNIGDVVDAVYTA
jgi:DNA-binding Xre family transcriptional regulator